MLEDSTMWLSTIGLLVTFGIGLLWTPLVATAQQPGKVYRIGILASSAQAFGWQPRNEALQRGLRELGYVEGKNLLLEYRWQLNSSGSTSTSSWRAASRQFRLPSRRPRPSPL